MERQDNKGSDHAIYCVAGIAILIGLAIVAMHSILVTHRIGLPLLRLQAQIYAFCLMNDEHAMELRKIDRILTILDSEVARTGDYSRIRTGTLEKSIERSTTKTRAWTRVCTSIILGGLGLCVIWQSRAARRRLFEGQRGIRLSQRQGVEEFLRITGAYLTPGMIHKVRTDPNPENLAHAFSIVRSQVNIPCCRVARLFQEKTRERLTLLEYGKTRVVFDDEALWNSKGRKSQI